MKQILIACGDVDLLRRIVSDLPPGAFKPIATRTGAGIAEKVAGRNLALAIVHEELADQYAAELCAQLRQQPDGPPILWLSSNTAPASGPFDRALKYPVPGPVFRNAVKQLVAPSQSTQDMEKWRLFYNELNARIELGESQSYFQILGLSAEAPHHQLVRAYDLLSQRYHPDRYRQFRDKKWGKAIHEKTTALYKLMTEAYQVLGDRKRRAAYERALADGKLRLDTTETSASERAPKSVIDLGTTTHSKKFLRLAQNDIAGKNLPSALQNLKFALSMEPNNAAIAQKIAQIQQAMNA
ncbi:DnaJ domain-containing protein [Bradymonas sediminis]|uniref:Uncharacterized protein n=1 Tax=Bradymonas sediminis TaxID=1548548 RepID=A0A2Z4FMT3_9DELT|nr:DnaJ domain-containing protein [Bradymonas sediminis]AWV90297.1 hypothetical protein DN745_13545 [Bradymonas sediminis]TDP75731.1 DnaJ-like protein [Bradymonas sediminis]